MLGPLKKRTFSLVILYLDEVNRFRKKNLNTSEGCVVNPSQSQPICLRFTEKVYSKLENKCMVCNLKFDVLLAY